MNQSNAKLWTILSGVVIACPSVFCLYLGVGILIGQGTFTPDANAIAEQSINPIIGLPLLCLGLLPWALPLIVWRIARRRPAPVGAPKGGSSQPEANSPFTNDPYNDTE